MVKNKLKIETFLLIILVGMALIPITNAQEEDYSVTEEKALEQANAHITYFVAADSDFENWIDASIDSEPLEL